MINVKDIQSTVKGLIEAPVLPACLAGVKVLCDDGKIESEEEKALETGECIVIGPPLGGMTTDQAGSTALIEVTFAVLIEQNPQKGAKNIFEILSAVKTRITGYKNLSNPGDVFRLADKAFIIDDNDPGLWSYAIFFTKLCVI